MLWGKDGSVSMKVVETDLLGHFIEANLKASPRHGR